MLLNSALPSASAASAVAPSKARISGSVTGTVNFAFGRPSAKATYMSNGYRMNTNGYLANPTRAAQVAANNAGALTRTEATRMGLPLGGRR